MRVGCAQDKRAGVGLEQRTLAAQHPGIGAVSRLAEDHRAVVINVALQARRVAGERSRADQRAAGVGVRTAEDHRACTRLGQAARARDHARVGQNIRAYIHRAIAGERVVIRHQHAGQGRHGRAIAREGHRARTERRPVTDRHSARIDRRAARVGVVAGEGGRAGAELVHRSGTGDGGRHRGAIALVEVDCARARTELDGRGDDCARRVIGAEAADVKRAGGTG